MRSYLPSKNKTEFSAGRVYVRASDHVTSPFRYPGGKHYALKHILPFLTYMPHDEYREPFVGGGSLFFAKQKANFSWLNDLEADLVDVYRVIANDETREELIKRLSTEIVDRKRHSEIKEYTPVSMVDRAFKTYFLNRTSYSGIIHKPAWGFLKGKSAPPKSWIKIIRAAGAKLKNVKFTNKDFEEVISAQSDKRTVLMYLDPPYFCADQKRAYTKSFILKDHLKLASILKKTKFSFCLSYDDCEEIRDLYGSWAYINERAWLYNTANCSGRPRKLGNELIITNYKVSSHHQGSLFEV